MKINVILLSWNRPRMLKEALESILNQVHQDLRVIIYDDGSDVFSIQDFIKDYKDERIVLAVGDKVRPEERIRPGNTQWSTNVNYVLSHIPRDEYVMYLCDDDILDLNWLDALNERIGTDPNQHLFLGDMAYFNDGDDPYTEYTRGFPALIAKNSESRGLKMWWSLGAFCHSMKCFYDEDVRWRKGFEGNAHSWDVQYIDSLQKAHGGYGFIPIVSVYRREHPNTMSAKLGRINEDGLYFKAGEELDIDAVTTPME